MSITPRTDGTPAPATDPDIKDTSTTEQPAAADGVEKTAVATDADGTAQIEGTDPKTVPPVNEFPASENLSEAIAAVAAAPVVMASTGNPGENARLKDIVLSDLPTIVEAQGVSALKEGQLFIAAFIYAPGTDKEWHASQIIDLLKSGRNMLHGLTQAFWHFHYRNRPPIGEKRGNSYVMLD
jgi:hypothetical protein